MDRKQQLRSFTSALYTRHKNSTMLMASMTSRASMTIEKVSKGPLPREETVSVIYILTYICSQFHVISSI
jgi:hypothetical protein